MSDLLKDKKIDVVNDDKNDTHDIRQNRNTDKILTRCLAAVWIWYMYTQFKTRWSVHHPLENYFTDRGLKLGEWLKHPIGTGRYESKICRFGHYIGWLLPIVVIIYALFGLEKYDWIKYSYRLMWVVVFVVSFILNLNSWLYLFPVFIVETRYAIYHS